MVEDQEVGRALREPALVADATGTGCAVSAHSGDDPAREAWPLCGYAPGSYMGRCHDCGAESWDLDKRAWQCLPCAVRTANKGLEDAARLKRAAHLFREFVVRNATQWRIGAGDHHHPAWLMMAELLPLDDIRNGPEWRFIQPENRQSMEELYRDRDASFAEDPKGLSPKGGSPGRSESDGIAP